MVHVCWLVGGLGLFSAVSAGAADSIRNERFEVTLLEGAAIEVATPDGTRRRFYPEFTVLYSPEDPGLQLRWCQIARQRLGENAYGQEGLPHLPYNVATWGRSSQPITVDPTLHVEDGFDPTVDTTYGEGRTANYYHAAPRTTVVATAAQLENGAIHWRFDAHPLFELSATVRLPEGAGPPTLNWETTLNRDGYYSVGYTGAPRSDPADVEAVWQPMIWNERRLPDQPYLTQAFRCPLPTTLVTAAGATTGVIAAPGELPFMPMPTNDNSPFGVVVRSESGETQSAIFAPVLGGQGSRGDAGDRRTFSAHLIVHAGDCIDTFEHLARTIYGFRDYRQNSLCSLNRTLETMIEYGMSEWSRFNDELRGCDYSTDAPDSVKNVSSLHPLSVALVTDDWEILKQRAWPMLEYALSREKFLFTTNPEQKTQNASTGMTGPGVPLSELTSLYLMSGRRADLFLAAAKRLYGQDKVFNLQAVTKGDRWQNALAIYRATEADEWRQRTIKLADAYLERRLATRPTDWDDPDAEGMFFWPSFVPQWIELLELYEAIPEQRYLHAAKAGARAYTQFIWFCPWIPEGTVRVNESGKAPRYRSGNRFEDIKLPAEEVEAWRVSEIGLTPESAGTCKGHRARLNAHYAPSMLRLSQLTGDKFLHDVARSAIIGRYANFPGYHMNTARTTVYEKPDFPLRPVSQLNGTTSMHFNHIWPHIALLLEYLVADVFTRSDGQIDFPSAYCEGYAYLQGKVFGHAPGRFYDDENVWLWMPKGLVDTGHVEVNYLAGRGNGKLYLALTNQSAEPVTTTVRLSRDLLSLAAAHQARVWRNNELVNSMEMQDGQFTVELSPGRITAISVENVEVEPRFQHQVSAVAGSQEPAWKGALSEHSVAGITGMVLSMGPELSSAYVYSRAPLGSFERLDLHYRTDDGDWQIASDDSYPFEWTVPLPATAERFEYFTEVLAGNGALKRTESVVFQR